MAKGSQRRSPQYERDQLGCMWGLISIFDFRQGHSTRKLLSDRRRGSRRAVGAGHSKRRLSLLTDFGEKRQGIDGGDKSEIPKVDFGMASVKKLMEEEMFSEQQPKKQNPSVAVEQIQSDLQHSSRLEKNCKQTDKTYNVACDLHGQEFSSSARLASQQPSHSNPVEESSHNLDLAAMMEEFCSQIHQCQEICMHHENGRDSFDVQKSITRAKHNNQLHEPNIQLLQKHSFLQGKLSEATEVFLNQKFIDAKQLSGDGAIHQSKQFMDALEILNSNKELFLKLLQDPNSLLVKHIQDLREARAEKVETSKSLVGGKLAEEEVDNFRQNEELVCRKQIQKHNMQNFFRRKNKSEDRSSSKGSDNSQASNRIVLLKPGSAGRQISETDTSTSLRNEGQSMRVTSHFSLREIKRKLKDAMRESRKDRHWNSIDGVLHRIPYNRQDPGDGGKGLAGDIIKRDIPSKPPFHIEKTVEPSVSVMKKDKIGNTKDYQPSIGNQVASTSVGGHKNLNMTTVGYPKQRESNIYLEAKKHLSEMLSTGDEDGNSPNRPVARTLGRILSLPEYNVSPIFSPRRDMEHSFVTAQMRFSPYDNFHMNTEKIWQIKAGASHLSPLRQNPEVPAVTDDYKPNDKLQGSDSNSDILNELLPDAGMQESVCSVTEDLSPKGDVEIVEAADFVCPDKSNLLDVPSEPCSSTPIISTNQSDDITKICEENESPNCSILDSHEVNQSLSSSLDSFSLSSSLMEKVEDLESISDRPERPSPVSVLEPYFVEDVISPTSTVSQHAEPPMEPLRIQFEEHDSSAMVAPPSDPEICLGTCLDDKQSTFEYVRAVLQASGLSWDEFLRNWPSEQLLDPSLFDEVEVLSSQFCSDHKLLFDCINEVLVELFECYFGCCPCVSFVKHTIRPVPLGKNVIPKVWEGIEWHLLQPLPPGSLDQIIGKDMAKAEPWIDLQSDTEDIGIEIEDEILDELMEDTILELCT